MFKFILLFQKKKLVLFNLSLLFFTNEATSISATSLKSIQGSAPYLIFDGQQSDDLSPLLTVKLPAPNGDVTTITKDTNSSANDPIILASNTKFSDIETFVKLPSENNTYPKIQLSNVLANSWGDEDGDEVNFASNNESLTLSWSDNEGNSLTEEIKNNQNMELDPCYAPYKLTLSADQFTLRTDYGVPRDSNYQSVAHDYYFYPEISSGVKFCYAQPNLDNQDNFDTNSWKKNIGFVTYDKNNPEKNFPTVGSNNLFFDIKFVGNLSVKNIIKFNGDVVTNSRSQIKLNLSEHDGKLRVTLKGPRYNNFLTDFKNSYFVLYADENQTKPFYSFIIKRWFIAYPYAPISYELIDERRCYEQLSTQNTKYFVPNVLDFTNADSGDGDPLEWQHGIQGVGPNYQRKISFQRERGLWIGGLFTEWGKVTQEYYPDSDWPKYDHDAYYWTMDRRKKENKNQHYVVGTNTGLISFKEDTNNTIYSSCVAWE